MQIKNYYKILNIQQDANLGEIKSAFRKLAKKYHPDLARENLREALALYPGMR